LRENFFDEDVMPSTDAKIPKKKVSIQSDEYLLRTLTIDDASDRWAGWMSDTEVMRMLNAPPRKMSHGDIVGYIKSFDQRSDLLLGIFEKREGQHIGFFAIHADYPLSQGVVNLLIGEAKYRHHGVLSVLRLQFAEYFFETLGLKTMMATALKRNQIILDTLLRAGWVLDRTLKEHAKSHTSGEMLDLCLLSLSREVWRTRNKSLTDAHRP
jgi:RimJ/RimL family protein N-acetyltransferase